MQPQYLLDQDLVLQLRREVLQLKEEYFKAMKENERIRNLCLRIQERWVSTREPEWCTFCNQHRKRHSSRCVLGLLDEILYPKGYHQP